MRFLVFFCLFCFVCIVVVLFVCLLFCFGLFVLFVCFVCCFVCVVVCSLRNDCRKSVVLCVGGKHHIQALQSSYTSPYPAHRWSCGRTARQELNAHISFNEFIRPAIPPGMTKQFCPHHKGASAIQRGMTKQFCPHHKGASKLVRIRVMNHDLFK